MAKYDLLFKIILIGDSSAGKTGILLKLIEDPLISAHLVTIGIDFKLKTFIVDDLIVKIQIVKTIQWDTAGQERFRTITQTYYRGSHAIIIVFNKSDRESFRSINKWIKECQKNSSGVIIFILGNKLDDNFEVSFEEGQELAMMHGFHYFEASGKSGEQVKYAFEIISRILVERASI